MARMIPAQIDEATMSAAERTVFKLFASDPGTETWTVLHSLGLARRVSGPFGEIDFVVILPAAGIVCLEVKGGGVACNAGEWTTRDRHGETHRMKRSPFKQAREGMFALKNSIAERFGRQSGEARFPVGSAIVFPDVACPPISPEFERPDVIDREDLRAPISRAVNRYVRRRLASFSGVAYSGAPPGTEAKAIRKYLSPDFDRVVARGTAVGQTEERLLRLTEEQYEVLEMLEANARCLFRGAAGTGKTVLSLEYARRAASAGAQVLLVCYNRLLGETLRRQAQHSGIEAGTWHSIVRRFIMASGHRGQFEEDERNADPDKLFEEFYPFYGELALEELGPQFDVLVVDEAQDLCDPDARLKLLDLALRGGLCGGRWAIFGDFTRQAIFSRTACPEEAIRHFANDFAQARLSRNCRNTRAIAAGTSALSGFDAPPFRLAQEEGLPVEYKYWKTEADLVGALTTAVRRLVAEGVRVEDIVILAQHRLERSPLKGVSKISHFQLVELAHGTGSPGPGELKFATIQSFKGLESKVVVIVDIDAGDPGTPHSLLYIGMSRARSLLLLLLHERCRAYVDARRPAAGGGQR